MKLAAFADGGGGLVEVLVAVAIAASAFLALDKGRGICYNMIAQDKSSSYNCIRSDKGNPIERWGRKATGLR